jgi:hypothetical protein
MKVGPKLYFLKKSMAKTTFLCEVNEGWNKTILFEKKYGKNNLLQLRTFTPLKI